MCKQSRSGLESLKKYIMVFLVIAIVLTSLSMPTTVSVYAAPGGTLAEKVEESQNKTEEADEEFILTNDLYYPEYIAQKDAEGYTNYTGEEAINISFDTIRLPEGYNKEDYLVEGYTAVEMDTTIAGTVFDWNTSDLKWVEFSVDVATKGYYNIEIEYYNPKGSVQTPQRSLNIDGDLVFSESVTVDFGRLWKDSTPVDADHMILNTVGDQVRPKQEEVYMEQTMRIQDHDGKYSAPLQFALDEGTHTIKLYYQYENIVIKSIKLVAPNEIPTYEEKLAQWKADGAQNANSTIHIEGEAVTYKSDTSLRVDGSSDPAASPSYENGSTRLNVIGGSTWASSNQTLTWNFDAPEAGLYQLTLRAYAKYTDGIPVYRQIRINGEVPFKEFECYEIPFADWDCFAFSANEEPLLVYLNKGQNTIQMTVKLGEIAEIMNALEKDSNTLSELVTDITKITSTNPDPNFEYQLDKKVPNLEARFQSISDSFAKQIERITNLSEKRPSAINNFEMMKEQFDRILNNTDIIAKNYTDLTDAMANLATWIKSFSSLPMQVDYIEFIPPEQEVKQVKSTIWQKLVASFNAFLVSFVKDYDAVGGIDSDDPDAEQTVVLDVWISRGKEWAQILKQLADEEFYTEHKIAVNMNILPSGQLNASASSVLLLALASGTAPDLALGVASNLPVEYGMRGAIYDLSQFEDFEEISDRFLDGIMIPFYFQDGYYGLPETMDFQCMYYRKDLLSAYDLEVPSTWTDVYSKILPILNNNGMDFYYAGGYNTFLFQSGGEYYTEVDGVTQSAWDSAEAIAGFKQWTDLYTIYDVPVTADFYTRFRSGQIPIGIGGMDVYTKLVSAAPEISGKWGVAVIPGVEQEDGQINRASGGSTSAAVILNTCENPEAAWEFLKWYTAAETQVTYANDIKAIIGPEAIWASANVEAFDVLPWDAELEDVIKVYQDWYKDAPNVIGGYIVGRYLENARVAVVVENEPYRPSLEKAVKEINRELTKKNAEFERRAEYEAQKAAEQE